MGVGRFALARLVRLYPMYVISLGTGAVATWIYQRPVETSGFFSHLWLNLFMLPSPTTFDPSNTALFPLDFTFWSLSFELAANLIYAAIAPRLSNRLLGAIVALGFLGLVASELAVGSLDNGTLRSTFLGGLARIAFGFFAGLSLFRFWRARPAKLSPHPALLFALLVLPLMFKPRIPLG